MPLTPQQDDRIERVIEDFDFPVTYFFNGMGFDPKDTLRRFAAELLKPERAAVLEEVATWYASEGYLQDEDDIADLIRNLPEKP